MRITEDSHTRLILEHRPVALTGFLLCFMLICLALTARWLPNHSAGSIWFWAGLLCLCCTLVSAFKIYRTAERVKVSFRRQTGMITIIHKTLFGLDINRYALADLEDIEFVEQGKSHTGRRKFCCLALKLKSQASLVPLHPRCMPDLDPSTTAQRIRNWVPIK
ncbi:hypothetical protein NBRC116601_23250 [Cognatishimia sp. WU-CL00825]|uniref:hypothetical protein n=1 Tax=Cognatishimia sp. WU-CL00825 TaxID=3127658 RepID=UPI0031032859